MSGRSPKNRPASGGTNNNDMSLINWRNRYDLMPGFPKWVDNFFRDEDIRTGFWPKRMEMPAVNIKETDTTFELEVAVPGMKKDDFKIEVKEGMLYISAETSSEQEEKEENYTRKEFNFSSFSRSFWLPENVKTDDIKANYKEGMLQVTLPKAEVKVVEKTKMIKVK